MELRDEVIQKLAEKAAELFNLDPSTLGADTRFKEDLGASSVTYVQFSIMLEEEYEVEVPFMEFFRKSTFGEAADYLAAQLGVA